MRASLAQAELHPDGSLDRSKVRRAQFADPAAEPLLGCSADLIGKCLVWHAIELDQGFPGVDAPNLGREGHDLHAVLGADGGVIAETHRAARDELVSPQHGMDL